MSLPTHATHAFDDLFQDLEKDDIPGVEISEGVRTRILFALREAEKEYSAKAVEAEPWRTRAFRMFWLLPDNVTIGQIR